MISDDDGRDGDGSSDVKDLPRVLSVFHAIDKIPGSGNRDASLMSIDAQRETGVASIAQPTSNKRKQSAERKLDQYRQLKMKSNETMIKLVERQMITAEKAARFNAYVAVRKIRSELEDRIVALCCAFPAYGRPNVMSLLKG